MPGRGEGASIQVVSELQAVLDSWLTLQLRLLNKQSHKPTELAGSDGSRLSLVRY
jgi:hypothetical protein